MTVKLPSITSHHIIARSQTPALDVQLVRYHWSDETKNFVVFTENWTPDYKLTTDTKIFEDFDEAFSFYQGVITA